ncbi:uncharacterized protein LOC143525889 [Brachyhypopomus gauderio]|uniref:uncharacterized protein LOC143525889 n=1 Tax=Brachyhypopomus gauderio TaxID=698409 RepID=UPI00404267B1
MDATLHSVTVSPPTAILHPAHDGTSDCPKMRAGVPLLLLMALAGFESVFSASLEVAEMLDVNDDTVEMSEQQKTDGYTEDMIEEEKEQSETFYSDEDTESEEEEHTELNFRGASRYEVSVEKNHEDVTGVIAWTDEEKDEKNATESEVEAETVDEDREEEAFNMPLEVEAGREDPDEHQDLDNVKNMDGYTEDMIEEEKEQSVFEE